MDRVFLKLFLESLLLFDYRSISISLFFNDSETQKDESVGGIFGGTPSRDIVTCLLLCAARDLKSSQGAVHVVGTVHCTQRNQRPCVKENDQIFLSIDS